MVFRIDLLCERWASLFKPIAHDPAATGKGKKFFRHDTYMRMEEFAQTLSQVQDTAMSVCTQFDGELGSPGDYKPDPKFIRYTQRIYFWVQQKQGRYQNRVDGELEAVEAKEQTQIFAQKFIAWLEREKKRERATDATTSMLSGIQFGSIAVFTHPKKYNGWWTTELVMEQYVPRELCVNDEDYFSE